VAKEAKARYNGDWMRSPDACKKRWKDVNKEVQLFCAATKFVNSIEHSGWSDDDYFKAAVEYYVKNHNDPNVTAFKFVEEWKFLRDFEKWKIHQATTTSKRVSSTTQDSSQSVILISKYHPGQWAARRPERSKPLPQKQNRCCCTL
jgi:hypothetical protein